MRVLLAVLACSVAAAGAAPTARGAQSTLGEGAWSWFGDPRAVTYTGDHTRTYVGWVDHEGDIKVSSYDHLSGERVTAVLAARLNKDDHANPSIHVRPDGRLAIFYSRHVGAAMHYRVSTSPEDVTSWEAPQTVPVNTPGIRGYTYPNPIRLEAEDATYLFWRGGNYNPTFSIQADGSSGWSPARNLINMPNERPYTKYASSGGDTIHVAYTNAHPNEHGDVNVYYARVRAGKIERAGGQQIGTLDAPIAPTAGDEIFDESEQSWVHDVAADSAGRPVIVFASFPSASDHRYHYARWTGTSWEVHEITAGGGSFVENGTSPYYSGGLTLDHEDPSRVYLSRQLGPNAWQVETWTTANGGADWTSQAAGAEVPSTQRNVRPVSPRGMAAFGGDLGVTWMNGSYPHYEDYRTSILGLAPGVTNQPPVADAEPSVRSGPAPLQVHFDGSHAYDPDGSIVSWEWDFGDGTGATGEQVTHTYTAGGRYFPSLTVTAANGEESVLVEEIPVGVPTAPGVWSGGASGSTAHGAVDPENQPTQWYFEYGPTKAYGAIAEGGSLPGDDSLHQVAAELPGLVPGRLYHYRLVASNGSGSSEGEDRVMVAGSSAPDAYREAVLGTAGLASYWRLGDLSGSTASEERAGPPGQYEGRVVLGQVGVLGQLRSTAVSFDGVSGALAAPGPALSTDATLEGWFRWRTGTATMRDDTGPSGGWLLPFNRAGFVAYRLGGQGFDTGLPIEDVRDGSWHHIVATKDDANAKLYIDGVEVHSGTGAGSTAAKAPWHVMRNGFNPAFSEGDADEVALYTRPLSAEEVRAHYELALSLAGEPLPPESPDPAAEPPAAGTGLGGGVLGGAPGPLVQAPAGSALIRRGVLVVRGAAGAANRMVARRRRARWLVSDGAAPLRPGPGCRRVGTSTVSCRAAKVKRIVLHGGDGNDRLAVAGRVRALLVGGRGNDRLIGGPFARFRGGPGADLVTRRR